MIKLFVRGLLVLYLIIFIKYIYKKEKFCVKIFVLIMIFWF